MKQSLLKSITPVDDSLFELVKGIDILDAVSPLNYRQEKSQFLQSTFSKNPEFVYGKHVIDPFTRKRELFSLPIENIEDEDLQTLYADIIESYVDKIDQFRSIGTPDFLYDSLRYFGEPSEKDINNAQFILHLPDDWGDIQEERFNAKQIVDMLDAFGKQEGYQYQIVTDDSMIANILVSGTTIKVNSAALVSETEVKALAHHELGVHLTTTLNARSQPLKILSLGCPVNTMTQEGLAILSEYLAGYMTVPRLKVLALRVLAVHSMINEKDFKKTFLLLHEQHNTPKDLAFTITARVYRGGGFTKDYLYLQGLHQMLNAFETRKDFANLMCGKVAIDYLPIVSRLVEKGYLVKPTYIAPAIANPVENNEVSRFIAHAIK